MYLYAATIFLSAFLLFLVQPVIARQILPWFGGSAVVWATCLVFFQSLLLAGYLYSHFVIRRLAPRQQLVVHAVMLTLSLAFLPITCGVHWKPTGSNDPALLILGLLLATIGLPYFMLTTTSPLVQAWYWQQHEARAPYRLFALSNLASLLALFAYPAAIEPWIPTRGQSLGWSALYVVFVLLCALTGYASTYAGRKARATPDDSVTEDNSSSPAASTANAAHPIAGRQLITWMLLSATGSCMLLAVTNHITQNVSAVPFLWLLPLGLYLLTWILAFDHPRWYVRLLFLAALMVLLPAMAGTIDSMNLKLVVALYTGGLFVGCMFCHGELARAKPEPHHLTTYYLMISFGGALGSVLVGIVAPLTLSGYHELGFVLVLLGAIAIARVWPANFWLRLAAVVMAIGTTALVWSKIDHFGHYARTMNRNFYGVVRTQDFYDPAPFRAMFHGGIMHSGQLTDPDARRTATSYFGTSSGYGRLFASLPEGARRIGVIGLGAGALAAYCRANDTIVFYELDPQVVDVARREFTYLDDVPGTFEIVLGDGRLSLESEPPRCYDVLAIDAFSGDSIPMHLITREAMGAYLKHLKPDGALVFQATNRYIDISPVVARLAQDAGMTAVMVSDFRMNAKGRDYWSYPTQQIIVTRNTALLESEHVKNVAQPIDPNPDFPMFTDDYTNLLRILK